jgi:hypothetical protein
VWLNVFGFVGLVIAATFVHLYPTVVGTRIVVRPSVRVALTAMSAAPAIVAAGYLVAVDAIARAGALLMTVGAMAFVWSTPGLARRGRWTTDAAGTGSRHGRWSRGRAGTPSGSRAWSSGRSSTGPPRPAGRSRSWPPRSSSGSSSRCSSGRGHISCRRSARATNACTCASGRSSPRGPSRVSSPSTSASSPWRSACRSASRCSWSSARWSPGRRSSPRWRYSPGRCSSALMRPPSRWGRSARATLTVPHIASWASKKTSWTSQCPSRPHGPPLRTQVRLRLSPSTA